MANYSVPVEFSGGFSTYIRLRFYLDKFPTDIEIKSMYSCAEKWLKKCEDGEYFGKPQKILSFQRFLKYRVPVFEVKYDIAVADARVTDELIETIEKSLCAEECYVRLNKVQVAYYNIDD